MTFLFSSSHQRLEDEHLLELVLSGPGATQHGHSEEASAPSLDPDDCCLYNAAGRVLWPRFGLSDSALNKTQLQLVLHSGEHVSLPSLIGWHSQAKFARATSAHTMRAELTSLDTSRTLGHLMDMEIQETGTIDGADYMPGYTQPDYDYFTALPEILPTQRMTFIPMGTITPHARALHTSHNGQVCSTWGRFHYKTFDGDIFYFPGLCNYVFASHCGAAYEDFNVQIRRSLVGETPTISRILINTEGMVSELSPGSVLINGQREQLPYSHSGFTVEASSTYVKVSMRMVLTIMWNGGDSVLLELDTKYANQTCGLCGDFNGLSTYNEFYSNNVRLTTYQFANLHKLDGPTEQCQDLESSPVNNCTNEVSNCLTVLNGLAFSDCNQLVDPSPYVKACVQDLCGCPEANHSSCMCATISEYSRQCAHAGGQPLNWRNQDLCYQACPSNMQYYECGSPCADTCSNPERSQLCEEHCVDGCFCPPGTVLDDIRGQGCVTLDQCHCTHKGQIYQPGASFSTRCSSCTCLSGLWQCEELPCPGTCSVEGGSHITTFDQKRYNVHGDCSYVLSKKCEDTAFTILGELRRCGMTDNENCLKSVTLNLNGGETVIRIQPNGGVFINSIYTQLPISAANITMFQPSTHFLLVHAAFGLLLQIQLVPLMQLSVRLDPSFRGQMCGLCGNFNQNQADDFAAVSGVVEGTGAAFANTWKTQADCANIKNSFENPCSLSVENENYAQHWCSLLMDSGGAFSQCHVFVNPEPYHKNCMFDTCNCEKSEDCLCAALSSYVQACAAQGVLLSDWRAGVCTKYMDNCPSSLSYSYMVESCQPTCRSLSEPDVTCSIQFTPVDGCICPNGTYLNDAGQCVPATQCPCYYKGTMVALGETVQENGVVCSCTNGKLNCFGDMDPNPVCLAPMIYLDCSNASAEASGVQCHKSCDTLDVACYNTQCVSGCVCPSGLVMDGVNGCVKEEACPCVHNGVSYKSGETIQVDCNTCICKSRRWECSQTPCLGTCTVYGDGHFLTFDSNSYNFEGNCEYTLAQDYCGGSNITKGTFRVITENIPCGTTGVTCSKAIKVFLKETELIFNEGHVKVVKRGPGEEVLYKIYSRGIYLVLETQVGLVLMWDRKTSIFIKLDQHYKGKVCGLCGNYDDNSVNDFTTRSLSVVGDVQEFGNSWKISPSCPDAVSIRDPCTANPYRKAWAQKQCSIINSAVFATCHSQVDSTKYYEACVLDACACDSGGDCECFCTAVAAYAQACNDVGVCVSWRKPDICPLFCDFYNPHGECDWHYQPCGAPCLKTCRNPSGQCLMNLPGLEGCYPDCPAEKPFFSESQMKCVEQCGCYDEDGNYYEVGEKVVTQANCQSCNCTASGIQCTPDQNECTCSYEGRTYRFHEVIYNTTDGLGACLIAICEDNGEIKRMSKECPVMPSTTTPFTFTASTTPESTAGPVTTISVTSTVCVQEACKWSDWYDSSTPGTGLDSGDFDTFENLQLSGYQICSTARDVECRARAFPDISLKEVGQKVECSLSHGLLCYNAEQDPPLCHDYEIRVLCCSYVPCGGSTVVRTSPPVTRSTTVTVASTSPTETLSALTSQTQSTPIRASTTVSCQPRCQWTEWFDTDYPKSEILGGDIETYDKIRKTGKNFCQEPQGIECQAENYPNMTIEEVGQVVHCDVHFGFICRNEEQQTLSKMCVNYKVRVLCCDDNHCNGQTQITSPAPTLPLTTRQGTGSTVQTTLSITSPVEGSSTVTTATQESKTISLISTYSPTRSRTIITSTYSVAPPSTTAISSTAMTSAVPPSTSTATKTMEVTTTSTLTPTQTTFKSSTNSSYVSSFPTIHPCNQQYSNDISSAPIKPHCYQDTGGENNIYSYSNADHSQDKFSSHTFIHKSNTGNRNITSDYKNSTIQHHQPGDSFPSIHPCNQQYSNDISSAPINVHCYQDTGGDNNIYSYSNADHSQDKFSSHTFIHKSNTGNRNITSDYKNSTINHHQPGDSFPTIHPCNQQYSNDISSAPINFHCYQDTGGDNNIYSYSNADHSQDKFSSHTFIHKSNTGNRNITSDHKNSTIQHHQPGDSFPTIHPCNQQYSNDISSVPINVHCYQDTGGDNNIYSYSNADHSQDKFSSHTFIHKSNTGNRNITSDYKDFTINHHHPGDSFPTIHPCNQQYSNDISSAPINVHCYQDTGGDNNIYSYCNADHSQDKFSSHTFIHKSNTGNRNITSDYKNSTINHHQPGDSFPSIHPCNQQYNHDISSAPIKPHCYQDTGGDNNIYSYSNADHSQDKFSSHTFIHKSNTGNRNITSDYKNSTINHHQPGDSFPTIHPCNQQYSNDISSAPINVHCYQDTGGDNNIYSYSNADHSQDKFSSHTFIHKSNTGNRNITSDYKDFTINHHHPGDSFPSIHPCNQQYNHDISSAPIKPHCYQDTGGDNNIYSYSNADHSQDKFSSHTFIHKSNTGNRNITSDYKNSTINHHQPGDSFPTIHPCNQQYSNDISSAPINFHCYQDTGGDNNIYSYSNADHSQDKFSSHTFIHKSNTGNRNITSDHKNSTIQHHQPGDSFPTIHPCNQQYSNDISSVPINVHCYQDTGGDNNIYSYSNADHSQDKFSSHTFIHKSNTGNRNITSDYKDFTINHHHPGDSFPSIHPCNQQYNHDISSAPIKPHCYQDTGGDNNIYSYSNADHSQDKFSSHTFIHKSNTGNRNITSDYKNSTINHHQPGDSFPTIHPCNQQYSNDISSAPINFHCYQDTGGDNNIYSYSNADHSQDKFSSHTFIHKSNTGNRNITSDHKNSTIQHHQPGDSFPTIHPCNQQYSNDISSVPINVHCYQDTGGDNNIYSYSNADHSQDKFSSHTFIHKSNTGNRNITSDHKNSTIQHHQPGDSFPTIHPCNQQYSNDISSVPINVHCYQDTGGDNNIYSYSNADHSQDKFSSHTFIHKSNTGNRNITSDYKNSTITHHHPGDSFPTIHPCNQQYSNDISSAPIKPHCYQDNGGDNNIYSYSNADHSQDKFSSHTFIHKSNTGNRNITSDYKNSTINHHQPGDSFPTIHPCNQQYSNDISSAPINVHCYQDTGGDNNIYSYSNADHSQDKFSSHTFIHKSNNGNRNITSDYKNSTIAHHHPGDSFPTIHPCNQQYSNDISSAPIKPHCYQDTGGDNNIYSYSNTDHSQDKFSSHTFIHKSNTGNRNITSDYKNSTINHHQPGDSFPTIHPCNQQYNHDISSAPIKPHCYQDNGGDNNIYSYSNADHSQDKFSSHTFIHKSSTGNRNITSDYKDFTINHHHPSDSFPTIHPCNQQYSNDISSAPINVHCYQDTGGDNNIYSYSNADHSQDKFSSHTFIHKSNTGNRNITSDYKNSTIAHHHPGDSSTAMTSAVPPSTSTATKTLEVTTTSTPTPTQTTVRTSSPPIHSSTKATLATETSPQTTITPAFNTTSLATGSSPITTATQESTTITLLSTSLSQAPTAPTSPVSPPSTPAISSTAMTSAVPLSSPTATKTMEVTATSTPTPTQTTVRTSSPPIHSSTEATLATETSPQTTRTPRLITTTMVTGSSPITTATQESTTITLLSTSSSQAPTAPTSPVSPPSTPAISSTAMTSAVPRSSPTATKTLEVTTTSTPTATQTTVRTSFPPIHSSTEARQTTQRQTPHPKSSIEPTLMSTVLGSQTTTSRIATISPQFTTAVSTPCQPKCEWTEWFDMDFPVSGINGGDIETYDNIRKAGGKICQEPQKLECRAENYPEVSIDQIGQVLQCNLQFGLTCRNEDQIGAFNMCFNYNIRVLCCEDYTNCPSTVAGSTTPTGFPFASTSNTIETTVHGTIPSPTMSTSTPATSTKATISTPQSASVIVKNITHTSSGSQGTTGKFTSSKPLTVLSTSGQSTTTGIFPPESPTARLTTLPTSGATEVTSLPKTPPRSLSTSSSFGTTTVGQTTAVSPNTSGTTMTTSATECQPRCVWTDWFDVTYPIPGNDGGDFETYDNIRAAGQTICEKPQGIQCRAENYKHMPIDQVGQVVECNVNFGLVCRNQNQHGSITYCLNYHIRVLCCDHHCTAPTSSSSTFVPSRTSYTSTPTLQISTTSTFSTSVSIPPVPHTSLIPSTSTMPCFCFVSGDLFSPGDVIYNKTDKAGCSFFAICNQQCEIERFHGPCPAPTSSVPSSTVPQTTPSPGCYDIFPPRQPGEQWTSNCQDCICDNSSLTVQCRPVQCLEPTPPPKCQKEGFVVVYEPQAGDPCCMEARCVCNQSSCPQDRPSCKPQEELFNILPIDSCCPVFGCRILIFSGRDTPSTQAQPGLVPGEEACQEVSSGDRHIIKIGSTVPSDQPCHTCTCHVEVNPETNSTVWCEPELCSITCAPDQEYKIIPGKCCGQCVPAACVTPDGKLIKVNETWVNTSADNCTEYFCDNVYRHPLLSRRPIECPDVSLCKGVLRKVGCCYECQEFENFLMPDPAALTGAPAPASGWRDGMVDLGKRMGIGPGLNFPLLLLDCQVQSNETLLQYEDCVSETIRLTFCAGSCTSMSMYSLEANEMQRECNCCQETQVHQEEVKLRCPDGREIQRSYTHVDACSCMSGCLPSHINVTS
ncbi:uncharacterized protein [Notamacropus eugenii]|uniref:uncharacterized protein n=1 Tax=Notamacropus eugenii TaxID=9315 RepID=UPI003B67CE3D